MIDFRLDGKVRNTNSSVMTEAGTEEAIKLLKQDCTSMVNDIIQMQSDIIAQQGIRVTNGTRINSTTMYAMFTISEYSRADVQCMVEEISGSDTKGYVYNKYSGVIHLSNITYRYVYPVACSAPWSATTGSICCANLKTPQISYTVTYNGVNKSIVGSSIKTVSLTRTDTGYLYKGYLVLEDNYTVITQTPNNLIEFNIPSVITWDWIN